METPQQREARIAQLEERRRNKAQVWPTADVQGTGVLPIEIGPGRGDLNLSSSNWPTFPTSLALIGHRRVVSFARLYMEQPWIAACVNWMLQRAIRVPLHAYRRGTETNDPGSAAKLAPEDSVLAAAIHTPWPRASTIDLVQEILGPVLVHGNSIIKIDDSGLTPKFVPQDWRFCRPIMPWRNELEGFVFNVDMPEEMRERVGVESVLHTSYWSPSGPIGISPLQQLGVTLQIEDAAQRYQRAVFAHGARPPSAITTTADFMGIDPKQREKILLNLRQDIMEIYSGPENAGRPALLPEGLDWKPVGHSSVEVELIDQRKITREEICAVYGLPLLSILGMETHATVRATQVQRDMIYTECLGPILVLAEHALNAQVLRGTMGETEIFYAFDFAQVLRGDVLAEIQALRDAIGTALLTPNEGRDVMRMPRSDLDGMDDFYLPFNNLQPVGAPPLRELLSVQQQALPPGQSPGGAPPPPPPTGPGNQQGNPGQQETSSKQLAVVRHDWRPTPTLEDELEQSYAELEMLEGAE